MPQQALQEEHLALWPGIGGEQLERFGVILCALGLRDQEDGLVSPKGDIDPCPSSESAPGLGNRD